MRRDEKPLDIDQIVAHLNFSFAKATRSLGFKNTRGTLLYELQTDFMWILHEITNGPISNVPKYVAEANVLISYIENEGWKEKEVKEAS